MGERSIVAKIPDKCPECGGKGNIRFENGCWTCYDCGASDCG